MRPDAPHSFGGLFLDRMGIGWTVSPMARMILRRLEANPLSTFLSILGISMGVAVLVLGSFMRDTIDFVTRGSFGRSQRQNVMLTFNETLSAHALHDVGHLPEFSGRNRFVRFLSGCFMALATSAEYHGARGKAFSISYSRR